MRIVVTEEHIKNGVRTRTSGCAIALAAKEAFGVPDGLLFVETDHILFDRRYTLPQEAQDFIDDYDTGLIVAPFSFEIDTTH